MVWPDAAQCYQSLNTFSLNTFSQSCLSSSTLVSQSDANTLLSVIFGRQFYSGGGGVKAWEAYLNSRAVPMTLISQYKFMHFLHCFSLLTNLTVVTNEIGLQATGSPFQHMRTTPKSIPGSRWCPGVQLELWWQWFHLSFLPPKNDFIRTNVVPLLHVIKNDDQTNMIQDECGQGTVQSHL